MTRDLKLYLEDMLNAVKEVEKFMMGLSFEDFCEDAKVTRAVTMKNLWNMMQQFEQNTSSTSF